MARPAAGGRIRRVAGGAARMDRNTLLPAVRNAQRGAARSGAGRHRRAADAARTLRFAGGRPGEPLLPGRHDTSWGEDSVLRPGIPPLQTPAYRRRSGGRRLGEHGLPELRAQFRSERVRLRPRIQRPTGSHLRNRPRRLPPRDPGRLVPPPPHPPLGRIVHADFLAAALRLR